ncbi:MAG: hypothetical protein HOG95_09885 [Rhodospirillaceae bacterium]|jgi:hypothetical protein|nr:hypothetical protein [Rhodospirillaceae bacterium]
MPVLLYRSDRLPAPKTFDNWCTIGNVENTILEPTLHQPVTGQELETAFDAIAPPLLQLSLNLGEETDASLSHTPAAAINVSDLSQMLAWTQVIIARAQKSETTLVLCDDPWLFRHLAEQPQIKGNSPPNFLAPAFALWMRGIAARFAYSLKTIAVVLSERPKPYHEHGGSWLLSYGHPESTSDGHDAYFGDLMVRFPGLRRVLHVDASNEAIQKCAGNDSTENLRAWGGLAAALLLSFVRWRPSRATQQGAYGWLVKRAKANEGATAQAAALRWQAHCAERWLAACRPAVVVWPWENHAWERQFVRIARQSGARTIGYQHATVAQREWNYSPKTNSDGEKSLPDLILCSGAAGKDGLLALGHPADRIRIGGALRWKNNCVRSSDPTAPVYVALPADHLIADEMIVAIRPLAEAGQTFVVKSHPMYPYDFTDTPTLQRTDANLADVEAISVVLYAATTVGLEALLQGLPVVRFIPQGRVSVDVVPTGFKQPAADAANLSRALDSAEPTNISDQVFAEPDLETWQKVLFPSSTN